MRKIYTGIDFGSHSIKIVVAEVINKKFHILSATSTRSKGIKNGLIVDEEQVNKSLEKAIKNTEDNLGVRIDKAIVSIPSDDIIFDIVDGSVNIESEDKIITGSDVIKVLTDSVLGKIKDGYEIITSQPISFSIDSTNLVKDPKKLKGDKLDVKTVITMVPKNNYSKLMNILKNNRIEVIDITFNAIGDYFEIKNKELDKLNIAIINMGYNSMEISIFNKGIMIKTSKINTGSKFVDKDIAYIYKLSASTANYVKESFSVSNTRYANCNDIISVDNQYQEKINIGQLEVSEIVEARLVEMLKLAKKEIKVLTNREISYIIVTGGISELAGFEYLLENIFDKNVRTLNTMSIGARSNIYSSALGILKYFDNKLELRGKTYSMFNDRLTEELTEIKKKNSTTSSDSIIHKVFGYFEGV